MPLTRNLGLILTGVPTGLPVAGEHLTVQDRPIDLDKTEPPEGGLLVKNLYLSFDPYQRGRMDGPSSSWPYPLNEPITNSSVSTVLKSRNPAFKVGDTILIGIACPMEEYSLIPGSLIKPDEPLPTVAKVDNPLNLDLQHFTHALSVQGLTAYASLYETAGPLKKGETIFISSAAGAVGQLVGQLAKHEGLRVIGSVGSDDKVEFIKRDLGFDDGWNYKKEKTSEALAKRAPEGIDIYYDNVGGEQLESALSAMKTNGRVIVCGMVSQYNKPLAEHYPVKNLILVLKSHLKIQGFSVFEPNQGPKYREQHQKDMMKWLADGSFKSKIDVTEGIENAAEGLIGMLEGKNFGKALLKV